MGFALYENNDWDAAGQLLSKGYLVDSKTPAIMEMPKPEEIGVYFAHTYEPSGPFGAKGIGEAATNPVAGAFANAIYNAIGVRFYELPITPEKILAAVRQKADALREKGESSAGGEPEKALAGLGGEPK